MFIPSYFNIAYCFSKVICTTRANTFVNKKTAGIPNKMKSDFAIGKSLKFTNKMLTKFLNFGCKSLANN